ncbi:helix-turn-helix transcriptional regulator [Mesorhizobium sp. M0185]|uniref:PadR family transcriptional regulator n=1 Tax=unclassified Mesorhizobium TaxID=325217 RepID=UPI00333C74FB
MNDLPRLSNIEHEILELLRSGEKYGLEMVRASAVLKRGTVYVTLDRMMAKGFVTSRAIRNPNEPGMARRVYSITALGQRVLRARQAAEAAFALGAPA